MNGILNCAKRGLSPISFPISFRDRGRLARMRTGTSALPYSCHVLT